MLCTPNEITVPQVLVSPDMQMAEKVSARYFVYYRSEQVNTIDNCMVKECTERKVFGYVQKT
jgi:hypothetical protein